MGRGSETHLQVSGYKLGDFERKGFKSEENGMLYRTKDLLDRTN